MMADLIPYFDRMSMMLTPTGKDLERVGSSSTLSLPTVSSQILLLYSIQVSYGHEVRYCAESDFQPCSS